MIEKNWMGLDGLCWFVGIVESRQDPLALGRVQVRAFAMHSSSLADVPTADLPWAIVAQSSNDDSSPWIKEGDCVLGIWTDGRSAQVPMVLFKLPGYQTQLANQGQGFNDLRTSATLQDAPRKPMSITYKTDGSGVVVTNPTSASLYPLAENLNKPTLTGATRYDIANTVIQQRKNNLDKGVVTATGLTWSEPYPAYNPLYPYNKATETESGHMIEFDDTPGSERITFTHRTGSFIDLYPSGSRVDKITKSKYSITMGDDYVHVMGRALVTVGQGVYIKALGDVNLECDNNLNVTANGSMSVAVGGALNIVAQSINMNVSQEATIVSGSDILLTAADQLELVAATTLDMIAENINAQIGAQAGTGNSLKSPGATTTPNQGVAGEEPTPTPWPQNAQYLDAYTGSAAKQAMFGGGDAAAPNVTCSFDINTHTFMSQPWQMSSAGLLLLQQREGLAKLLANGNIQSYPDPVIGPALLTIGYGTTSVVLPPSAALTPTTVITPATASQYINDSINNIFLPKLQQYVTVQLTQNMVDALLSLMYNIGVGNFSTSNVLKYLNQQNWCSAANAMLLWNTSQGSVVAGLTTRRQSEKAQFLQ